MANQGEKTVVVESAMVGGSCPNVACLSSKNVIHTHVGEDDCRVVLDNLAGGGRTTRGRLIPYCLFTDQELASGDRGLGTSNVVMPKAESHFPKARR